MDNFRGITSLEYYKKNDYILQSDCNLEWVSCFLILFSTQKTFHFFNIVTLSITLYLDLYIQFNLVLFIHVYSFM